MLAAERLKLARQLPKSATAALGAPAAQPAGAMNNSPGTNMMPTMPSAGAMSSAKSVNTPKIQVPPVAAKPVTNTIPQGIARSLGNVARAAGHPRF
jgi:hypothetical protein